MHMLDVMKYGDRTLRASLSRLPHKAWERPGACGHWSPKDILAHLASYERLLADVIRSLQDESLGKTLLDLREQGSDFNEQQVISRGACSIEELMDEYSSAQQACMERAANLDRSAMIRTGALDWYGPEYDLEDYVVYTSYGHKREHGAQINAFVDLLRP